MTGQNNAEESQVFHFIGYSLHQSSLQSLSLWGSSALNGILAVHVACQENHQLLLDPVPEDVLCLNQTCAWFTGRGRKSTCKLHVSLLHNMPSRYSCFAAFAVFRSLTPSSNS